MGERRGGVVREQNRAQMEQAIAGFPDTQLETREEWIEREDADFNEFISFLYVMLTLAVFVSVFGMINTLVLSVYERTREIGMLRSIGMSRRQVRRMIRQESIITALIGTAIGLPLGIFLAALVNRALSEYDVRFAIPWTQLGRARRSSAVVIGILAAIFPARRAAKLDPLEAICSTSNREVRSPDSGARVAFSRACAGRRRPPRPPRRPPPQPRARHRG